MALRGGAKQVYACEMSGIMVSLCRKVLDINNELHRVKLIHAVSTDLKSLDERFYIHSSLVF